MSHLAFRQQGVDYAVPEVRAHYLSIVTELANLEFVGGVELDFYRHPTFFRVDDAYSNCYMMTDFMQRCRAALYSRASYCTRLLAASVREHAKHEALGAGKAPVVRRSCDSRPGRSARRRR